MEVVNELWVEKYRPRTLKDCVLPEEYTREFSKYIESHNIPNLMMYGPPGGGKTTVARILTSKHGIVLQPRDNLLAINGSAKETRGINFVQDVIEPFLKVPPAGNDKFKVVFIDEGDYLTDASVHSMRGIIEKYQVKYGRFILTCNYVNNLPEAFQSRFTGYQFKQLPLEFLNDYTKKILDSEKIKYKIEDVEFIVNSLYPDVRKIVNKIQRFSGTGTLKVDKSAVDTTEKTIVTCITEISNFIQEGKSSKISKPISQIINLLDKADLDYRNVYTTLFYAQNIPVPAKIVINKYSNSHQNSLVSSMHFMSCVFELVQSLSSYFKSIVK